MNWVIGSIRGRFLAAITLISVAAMSVIYLWNYHQIKNALLEQQTVQINGLIARLQTTLPNALWEYNLTQLAKSVDAEMGVPYIVAIKAYDGQKLVYTAQNNELRISPGKLTAYLDGPEIYLRRVGLFHNAYATDREIGHVEVFISDAYVLQTIAAQSQNLIARLVLSVLAILAVTYLVLIFMVIKPLSKVRDALEQVTADSADLSTRLAENPMIEFRGITVAFNRFVAKVQRVLGGSIDDVHTTIQEVAKGDLTREIPVADGDTESIMSRLAMMQTRLLQMRSLKLARDAADSASRAKTEFISNMNHEIRNPLTAIIGMTDMLETTNLDAEQREFVHVLHKSSNHLLGIVNNILDYSKLESNHLVLETVPFRMRDIMSDAVDVTKDLTRDNGVKLVTQMSPQAEAALLGDPLRIRQILINYLNNAIRFAARGNVTVRVFMPSVAEAEGVLRIEVEDNGPGIDPSQLPKLFQRFSQEDSSTTRRFGGTGLGLAICKRLAELMNGRVGATSTPGVGSCFWCELQVGINRMAGEDVISIDGEANASGSGMLHTREAPPKCLENMRILLVEDVLVNQKVVSAMLTEAGVEVHTAGDGMHAVEKVTEQCLMGKPFDVVLMDLHMPIMDGFSATEEIMSDPMNTGLRIIAMTADATTGVRKQVLEKGACDFLSKPFVRTTLWTMLARHRRQDSRVA